MAIAKLAATAAWVAVSPAIVAVVLVADAIDRRKRERRMGMR